MGYLLVAIATTAVVGGLATLWGRIARRRLAEDEEEREPTPVTSTRANLLLATMSHEIRTPLNGVLGMLELLEGTQLDAEQRAIVRMIADSGQVLSHVVDDYLAYYRLESGQSLTVSPGACELDEVVLQSMMQFQGLAYDKGLGLTLLRQPSAPHVVKADALRLRQILANLILNAIKYTDVGEVCVAIEQEGGRTDIAVSDTGPGLDERALESLFEPFQRDHATAGREQGSGLGLTIARQLTEALGGQLSIASEVGVGTTFTLSFDFEVLVASPPLDELPFESALIVGGSASAALALADILAARGLRVRHSEPTGPVSHQGMSDLAFIFSERGVANDTTWVKRVSAVRIEVRWLSEQAAHGDDTHVLIQPFSPTTVQHTLRAIAGGARRTSTLGRWRTSMAEAYPLSILIAEDDATSARVIIGMLERLGYSPTVVSSGPQAVAAISAQHFDICLLDINLPGFGGVEILTRVRAPSTWWIATSASVQPELRKRCRDAGFRDFLAKPMSVGSLRSALVRGSKRDSGVVDTEAPAGSIRQMRELFAESPAAYRSLLESHIAQTDLLCADLDQGLAGGGDLHTARRAAHTLQAAAASFGCQQVASHARTLDVEWDTLEPAQRRQIAQRLIAAWRDSERASVESELASIPT